MKDSITAIILADKDAILLNKSLASLKWVDEIILIDTGLDKKKISLAKKFKAKIIKAKKNYDFSLWRNQGAVSASGKWLLYLDSDEQITPELKKEIQAIILLPEKYSAFYLPRKNFFWGKEFKTEWPDYQLRLIKRENLIKWKGKIHEKAYIRGKTGKLKNPLIHYSHRNFADCLKKTMRWSLLEAENRLQAGHPPMTGWRFLRIIFSEFFNQFFKKRIWLNGAEGIIEGLYQIFSIFTTYVRLWQLQQGKK